MSNVWHHRPGMDLDVASIFDPFGNAVHTALSAGDGFIPPFSAVSGERFTCAFWGESVRTSVRLPSGKTVSTTVVATPHHSFSCTA